MLGRLRWLLLIPDAERLLREAHADVVDAIAAGSTYDSVSRDSGTQKRSADESDDDGDSESRKRQRKEGEKSDELKI